MNKTSGFQKGMQEERLPRRETAIWDNLRLSVSSAFHYFKWNGENKFYALSTPVSDFLFHVFRIRLQKKTDLSLLYLLPRFRRYLALQ